MIAAAERIRQALKEADEGGYPRSALFYVSREDVEAVLAALEGQDDVPLMREPDGHETPASILPYEIKPLEGGFQLVYKNVAFSHHKTREAAEHYARRLLGYEKL